MMPSCRPMPACGRSPPPSAACCPRCSAPAPCDSGSRACGTCTCPAKPPCSSRTTRPISSAYFASASSELSTRDEAATGACPPGCDLGPPGDPDVLSVSHWRSPACSSCTLAVMSSWRSNIPVVGLSLMLALMPACSAGTHGGQPRGHPSGKFPMPTVFLSAFRAGRQAIEVRTMAAAREFSIVGGFWIIVGVTSLIDGGGFASGSLSGKMLPAWTWPGTQTLQIAMGWHFC